jgi:hypothetical protein
VVYVLAALWGAADAIWQTQINALYGVLFAKNEEAAFSNYRLWESLGFLFAFLTQVSQFCSLCGTRISKEVHVFCCRWGKWIQTAPSPCWLLLAKPLPATQREKILRVREGLQLLYQLIERCDVEPILMTAIISRLFFNFLVPCLSPIGWMAACLKMR